MQIADAPHLVALAVALAAGVVSFLSPCVFPLVPGYLAFVSGAGAGVGEPADSAGLRARVLVRASSFVLGFSTVFTLLGLGTAAATEQLVRHRVALELTGGLLVVLLGLAMVWGLGLPTSGGGRLARTLREPSSIVGSALVGAAFAIAWTPCIGPALGAILAVAGSTADLEWGATLLFAYSMGLGVPFLAAAAGTGRFLRLSRRARPHLRRVQAASGAVLVLMGALIATGAMARLSSYLARFLPDWMI